MTKTILVTGSSGLIGSEVSLHFGLRGWNVVGIDNNQRAKFFGKSADTTWNKNRIIETLGPSFCCLDIDIRDRSSVFKVVEEVRPVAVVHCAAQPSHDKAAEIPFDDFETNALGTLNLLEAFRRYAALSPFVFLSTNKVYGDGPNEIPLCETETRWEFSDPAFKNGISESFTIDQVKHSLFGASKLSADILVQEYGRYFSMPTCCLRGGCLTGPNHSGVQLHGFLSYLIKCNITRTKYTIYGYKGKQVRDNIHSGDVASFIELYIDRPIPYQVYNIGGGFDNSCSLVEAFDHTKSLTGYDQIYDYSDAPRVGDHICYYSDLSKIKQHYPSWEIRSPLSVIFEEITTSWKQRIS